LSPAALGAAQALALFWIVGSPLFAFSTGVLATTISGVTLELDFFLVALFWSFPFICVVAFLLL
jgi:hypothetical protein